MDIDFDCIRALETSVHRYQAQTYRTIAEVHGITRMLDVIYDRIGGAGTWDMQLGHGSAAGRNHRAKLVNRGAVRQ